ncbi:MAG: PDGLE domain-containing protein [Firmicutes bacterium]|nr:PDGLE domain-containing protein [Bacillota bacterium]
MKRYIKLWIGIAILIILTPLGLIASGTAWGEWTKEEIKKMLGFVPAGMDKVSHTWKAFLEGYGFKGWDSPFMTYSGYALSALIGVVIIIAVSFILGKLLSSKNRDNNDRS